MSNQVQGQGARQRRILITLAICVAAILLATVFGSYIQTAGWRYTVEDLRNATNSGTIELTTYDDVPTADLALLLAFLTPTTAEFKSAAEQHTPAFPDPTLFAIRQRIAVPPYIADPHLAALFEMTQSTK